MWVENFPKVHNCSENVSCKPVTVKYHTFWKHTQRYRRQEEHALPEGNQGIREVYILIRKIRGYNLKCDNFFTTSLGRVTAEKRNYNGRNSYKKNS